MVGSGGLLGRRKASFSTGKASAGSSSSAAGSSNASSTDRLHHGSNGSSRGAGGVKLTLDNADDDELDAAGELDNGGIKFNNYSYNGANGSNVGAGFPVVGAGSRLVARGSQSLVYFVG